ncbi:hypothetical protein EPA93_30770 [Ktedonosporobacter rubrisoli]|uniref:PpiC domain-containing protein n=1 Tax=Ktedonosporobacter rubrisoli TaxID=2509675 RepID=A0A4P6JYK4_KTERU|nr:peptidylprolyl isomerase [Ktedonosporobacter rubrisoli]QBD80126.1 hypothetical protein EPA93_30770 [Ktedonosporobacter rubrisoli]
MKSQTARRPDTTRSSRSAKNKKYVRQTAHVEARRDGKPLIFGWGGHLSHSEKTRLQRRAIWFVTAIIGLIIVLIIVGYWVNLNVIVPSLPITAVNGQSVPQSDYRKLLAVNTQYASNHLNGPNGLIALRDQLKSQVDAQQKIIDDAKKQIDDLNGKIKALPADAKTQRADLENQLDAAKKQQSDAQASHDQLMAKYQDMVQNTIPNAQTLFTQSQLGNDSSQWLQDDIFIRNWLDKQNSSIRTQIEPTSAAIERELSSFKANMPKITNYSKFLSEDNVSDADVHAMIALKLRRQDMQNYLAAQTTSPTYQVLARAITASTMSDANKILDQLKHGADFGKLAKDKSVDTNTNSKGGDLGWMARGQYTITLAAKQSAVVDNWIFDRARTLNELSPVLTENGAYHIVQIMNIDPSHVVDAANLQQLKGNALLIWLKEQAAQPGVTITPVDQNKMLDPSNIPPGLPAGAPSQGGAGAPGGAPGGLPGGLPGGIPGGMPGGLPGGAPGGIPGQ